MDVDKAASIFVGTILIGLTCMTAAGVVVLINNIFSRWWKPIPWMSYTWTEYREPMPTATDSVKHD